MIIREIEKKFLGEFTQSVKTQKVFEMLKKGGIDKHSHYGLQNIILKDIRDEISPLYIGIKSNTIWYNFQNPNITLVYRD